MKFVKSIFQSIINIFTNKKILFLIIVLIVALSSYKIVEGFDSLDSIGTTTQSIPEQYKYLAPIPEGSVWNPELQDKFVAKIKETNPNFTKAQLNDPVFSGKSFMQSATAEEAQYYLDNGLLWPYDDYVISELKKTNPQLTDEGIDSFKRGIPNRVAYMALIANATVPQLKMLNDIFINIPHKTDNGKYWKCDPFNGDLQLSDSESGTYTTSTDVSFFKDNIPGFSFSGDPCNVCSIPPLASKLGAGYHPNLDVYNSSENTCKFQMSGDVPEAYNVYLGKYGNSQSEPASVTSDNKKCMEECTKKCT